MPEKHRFICEDTLEGIFTAVYDAWASRCGHENVEISVREPDSLELFCQYHYIPADQEKSMKVARTLQRRLNARSYEMLCYAAVSQSEDKGTPIYQSIVECLCGCGNLTNQKHPGIRRVNELYKNTWYEYHHLLGFTRFKELSSGVLFSVIHPKNDVLLMLGEHFADRLSGEHFAIYDRGRHKACIHQSEKPCMLLSDIPLLSGQLYQLTDASGDYESLWVEFCKSIAIQERKNRNLQRQMLPLRFRDTMTEFIKKTPDASHEAGHDCMRRHMDTGQAIQ